MNVTYTKRIIFLAVLLCLLFSGSFIAYTVNAQYNTSVEALVPDHGQGRSPINISHDKTEEFVAKYGKHTSYDKIISELTIWFLELLLILLIVGSIYEIDKTLKKHLLKTHHKNY